MIRRLIAISAVITLIISAAPIALAQSFGNSGSRGGMGSSGFGSSAFGSGGMGGMSGGMGGMSGGMGGMSGGMGGMGGGMGGMSGGMGGMGGGMGSSGFGGGNSMFGNSGMGGSSRNGVGGQNFVGRDATDMQATFGQMGKASTQFFNQMNRSMKSSNRKQTNKTVQSQAQPMRVEVKVAFDAGRPTSNQLAETVRTRLARVLAGRHMAQPVVNMEGDTAVISGVAASENERDVISQLLAIEPGVRDVRNEMTIGQPANADIVPAPGS